MVTTPRPTKSSTTGSQASSDTSWVDVDRKRRGDDLETSMAVEREGTAFNAATLIPEWQIEGGETKFVNGKLRGQTYMKVLQTIPREFLLYQKSYKKLDEDKRNFVDRVRKNSTTVTEGEEFKILPKTKRQKVLDHTHLQVLQRRLCGRHLVVLCLPLAVLNSNSPQSSTRSLKFRAICRPIRSFPQPVSIIHRCTAVSASRPPGSPAQA